MVSLTPSKNPSLSLSTLDANIARAPLHDMAGQMSVASSTDNNLTAITEIGQINLRVDGGNGVLLENIRKALGLPLPTQPNTSHTNRARTTIWLGPDEWLILCPLREVEATMELLREVCVNRHAAIVDVSDNRAILSLSGARVWKVLQKGCTLDLHPATWHPDMCAQTLFMRAQIILLMQNEAPTFWLMVRPSFATYLAQSLIEAMAEFKR